MAEETNDEENVELHLHSTGELLRRAREQKNLSLEDIAKKTRIPQRHLEAIESGDFDALPGRTYAIGFAKSYARTVGLVDAAIGSQLRAEMDEQGHGAYQPEVSGYAPANPSSIPPRYLAWTAAGIGALVLIGYLVWRTLILNPGDLEQIAESDSTPPAESATAPSGEQNVQGSSPTPSSQGIVVLTATEPVWMKIYDAEGERLFEDEMAAGDTFTVPADANDPQILTGRPAALTVTIDGQVVPQLGTAERTIKDVGVSAAALLARETVSNPDADLSSE
ncbi:RodZ domain-containing protein [Sphingorhabdus sp. YGSMI21]|uniref:helix-turn-helix domain-containing protein n=1 Tax=Sphingorhabdus sp. YGSMI21 TaxID=2077182 RepID=UPI0013DB3E1C|nr:RodZ domain-containing protein [Sphingorhabdus sp. YGSMI21]